MIAATCVAFLLAQAPLAELAPPRYGDAGTNHLGLTLGLGAGRGGAAYAAGISYGYFLVDGVAPGADLSVSGGSGLITVGQALATLRLVPVRTGAVTAFVVGRAGRIFLADGLEDGWGAGGGAGAIFFGGGRTGLALGYEIMSLFPRRFCAALAGGCRLQGLSLGLVVGL